MANQMEFGDDLRGLVLNAIEQRLSVIKLWSTELAQQYIDAQAGKGSFQSWILAADHGDNYTPTQLTPSLNLGIPNQSIGDVTAANLIVGLFNPRTNALHAVGEDVATYSARENLNRQGSPEFFTTPEEYAQHYHMLENVLYTELTEFAQFYNRLNQESRKLLAELIHGNQKFIDIAELKLIKIEAQTNRAAAAMRLQAMYNRLRPGHEVLVQRLFLGHAAVTVANVVEIIEMQIFGKRNVNNLLKCVLSEQYYFTNYFYELFLDEKGKYQQALEHVIKQLDDAEFLPRVRALRLANVELFAYRSDSRAEVDLEQLGCSKFSDLQSSRYVALQVLHRIISADDVRCVLRSKADWVRLFNDTLKRELGLSARELFVTMRYVQAHLLNFGSRNASLSRGNLTANVNEAGYDHLRDTVGFVKLAADRNN